MLLPLLWVFFLLCTNIILAPLQGTLNLGKSLQNSSNNKNSKIHLFLSKTLLLKILKKFDETYFWFLTLDSRCWWCFETCRKAALMEDWGGEEGLQNNFAKRWNRELGLFSMLGNKVVNSCLGGRTPDQRGDLARNWQTVQRHHRARWVDRCEKEKGIICQIFALASKLGKILNFSDVFCPFSVKWRPRLKHVS